MAAIFVTGNSNGLGLTRYYQQQGDTVYSISRSSVPRQHDRLRQPA